MSNHLIVSFSTRPSRGGEGGVGWHFLVAAAERAKSNGSQLTALIDKRDESEVGQALAARNLSSSVELRAVPIPKSAMRWVGSSRSRESYMAWLPRARSVARGIVRDEKPRSVHQVTFATMFLPSVVRKLEGPRRVWGPVGIPRIGNGDNLGKAIARANSRGIERVIALNDQTVQAFREVGRDVDLEPNIFCEPREPVAREEGLLVTSGLLIKRKRPWISIAMLREPGMAEFNLRLVGDGPLRTDLERFAEDIGVAGRVEFVGSVSRDRAIHEVSRARCLVHPSSREGSPWVVGEAASVGVAAAVFASSGAGATVRLSGNGGVVIGASDRPESRLAEAVKEIALNNVPPPSTRWSSARLPGLLQKWWTE